MEQRLVMFTAMEFARRIGILETIGALPENCFQNHWEELAMWAEEFTSSSGMKDDDLNSYFEKKMEFLKQG